MVKQIFILFLLCVGTFAANQNFHIDKSDKRMAILLEDFGFKEGGHLHVKFKNNDENAEPLSFAVLRGRNSFSPPLFDNDNVCEKNEIDVKNGARVSAQSQFVITFTDNAKNIEDAETTVFSDTTDNYLKPGYFFTYLIRCDNAQIDADFEISQYNARKNDLPNYLSAGMIPVPAIVLTFAFFWIALMAGWGFLMIKGRKKVNRVHVFLAIYIFFSIFSLFFQYGSLSSLRSSGSFGGISVPYFLFAISRGILFFILIITIGSGISFVKNHLTKKETILIISVIVIQILANIAFVLCEKLPKTNPARSTWLSIFRLCDLICCCCVVVPVLWSVNSLRKQAALAPAEEQAEQGQSRAVTKLTLFRRYYLLVIGYVYLRIIVIYLLDMYILYTLEWLIDLFDQTFSLAFYCLICWLFRPEAENPFISFEKDDYVAPTLFATELEQQTGAPETIEKRIVQNSAVLIDDEEIQVAL